ncbi:hypothetical protein HDU85_003396 [Gaertneriomyces sp. JEL0708]|nr:hypothetical protein HDU85_003396 [Gaertneriomyces sp. JEL0708]
MCPPCTAISPEFERLLNQYNHEFRQEGMGEASRRDMCKIVGVKVDITVAREIAQHYGITATPTFVFYLDGNKFHEFRGANRTELQSGMELLLNAAFPPHPHNTISTPVLDALPRQAITFTQSSHLDDIFAKISNAIKERSLEVDTTVLNEIKKAIKAKHEEKKAAKLELPHGWQTVMRRLVEGLNEEQVFPVLDILRLLILDEDAGQSYIGPNSDTLLIEILHRFGGSHASFDSLPKSVMIMTLRLACNHFAHKSSTSHILSLQHTLPPYGTPNRSILTALLIPSLLSPQPQVKIVAASLAYNITLEEASQRRTSSGVQGSMEDLGIHEEWICELVAAIAKALEDVTEDQQEMVLRLVGSLGWSLRYSTEGVRQLAAALSVGDIIKKVKELFKDKGVMGQRIAGVCEELYHLCRV